MIPRTGYLLNDNRTAWGWIHEADTVLCRHCQRVIELKHRSAQGAWCGKCSGYVCPHRPCATVCTPVLKQVDEALQWAHRAGSGLAGLEIDTIRKKVKAIHRGVARQETAWRYTQALEI